MKEHPEKPEEWQALWLAGELARVEFFQGLYYSAKFASLDRVVSALRPHEFPDFEADARETVACDDGSEMITFGSPPKWDIADVRRIVNHLDAMRAKRSTATGDAQALRGD